MITPTVIILLKLPFVHGMSHPVKATSGSLVVSGCGRRYGNSAQHFAASHFPSLHAGAAPHGGIFTLADTTQSSSFFSVCFRCPVVWSFSLVLRGTREAPHSRAVGHLMAKAIDVALTIVCPNRSRAAGYSDKIKKKMSDIM
jgi:hypothetical protein